MRIHENPGEEDQVNMTPLIDMVFLLLIFFLVATQIAAEERDRKIQLPVTGAPKPLSAPPEQFIINIDKEGNIKVNGQLQEMEQLKAALTKLGQQEKPQDVLIRADQQSFHKYFATVAAMCHDAGISAINIGYIYDAPKEE